MIRYSKILILCVVFATLVFSCAKEFSDSNPFIIPAKGSLLDSSGGCLPSVVHGTYYNGVKTNPDSNYVQLIVHVASVGAYKIVSDTANGLIFKDSGFFYTTGYDTILLKAAGTPTAAQTNLFSVTFDSTIAPGCNFEVIVKDSTGGGSTGNNAVFSLETASTTCTNTIINGSYASNVPLTTSNTIIVPVNVTSAGAYTLETNTVNGYKFAASGIFTSTGNQNITLTGIGTPTVMGTDIFKPQVGSVTGCIYTINVAAAPAPAVFTFEGSPSACANATVNGTYTANSALTSTNTITLSANVTSTGAFSITTNAVNGMTFSASGIFTSTGVQPVTLTGTGTPAASGNFTFTPQGTSGCSFDVTVNPAPVATGILTCTIDGAAKVFNYDAHASYPLGPNDLFGNGITAGGGSESFSITVTKSDGSAVKAGTYTNTLNGMVNGSYMLGATYTDPSKGLWSPALPFGGTPDAFTIVITSITSTSVKGTFNGTVRDNSGTGTHTKTVTNGVFDLPIQ